MKKVFLISSLLFISLILKASEPQEMKIYNEYQKYYSIPTDPISWSKVVESRPEKIYQVQKGDTLWDVSKVLFGDPDFWPKVWSVNRRTIYNPHQILPQMTLKFFEGSLAAAPVLKIEEVKNASVANTEKAPDTKMILKDDIGYHDLPDNLPSLTALSRNQRAEITGMNLGSRPTDSNYKVRYMISEEKFESLGSPFEFGRNNLFGSIGDEVDVKSETPLKGEHYIFVELVKSVSNYYIYKYLAEAKFKENLGDDGQALEITRSLEPLGFNAILIEGRLPELDLSKKVYLGLNDRFKMIDSPPRMADTLATLQGVFFIDGGTAVGLQKGVELDVISTPGNAYSHREHMAGKAIVVQAGTNFSTIVITESKRPIGLGDHVIPSNSKSASNTDTSEIKLEPF